eukprot:Gb_29082 [translate_table: standard]
MVEMKDITKEDELKRHFMLTLRGATLCKDDNYGAFVDRIFYPRLVTSMSRQGLTTPFKGVSEGEGVDFRHIRTQLHEEKIGLVETSEWKKQMDQLSKQIEELLLSRMDGKESLETSWGGELRIEGTDGDRSYKYHNRGNLEKDGIPRLEMPEYMIKLADQGRRRPQGILKDVLIEVVGVTVTRDFTVVEMNSGTQPSVAPLGSGETSSSYLDAAYKCQWKTIWEKGFEPTEEGELLMEQGVEDINEDYFMLNLLQQRMKWLIYRATRKICGMNKGEEEAMLKIGRTNLGVVLSIPPLVWKSGRVRGMFWLLVWGYSSSYDINVE